MPRWEVARGGVGSCQGFVSDQSCPTKGDNFSGRGDGTNPDTESEGIISLFLKIVAKYFSFFIFLNWSFAPSLGRHLRNFLRNCLPFFKDSSYFSPPNFFRTNLCHTNLFPLCFPTPTPCSLLALSKVAEPSLAEKYHRAVSECGRTERKRPRPQSAFPGAVGG